MGQQASSPTKQVQQGPEGLRAQADALFKQRNACFAESQQAFKRCVGFQSTSGSFLSESIQ